MGLKDHEAWKREGLFIYIVTSFNIRLWINVYSLCNYKRHCVATW